MKVQRYLYGRTNIGQLESGRASLRSPEKVAEQTYAPYGAVAGAAESISNDLFTLAENDKKIKAKEDKIQMEVLDKEWKFGIENIMNDPQHDDEIQDDGTPTRQLMREKFETFKGEWIKKNALIQDDDTREDYRRVREVVVAQNGIEFERVIQEKREAWTTKGLFDLRSIATEVGDYDEARKYTEELRDSGAISQDSYEVDLKQIKAEELDTKSTEWLESKEKRITAGMGEEVLADLLANPDPDPDLQKMKLAGVRASMYNHDLARSKHEDALVGEWMRETDNLINSIASEGAEVDIDSLYKTMIGTGVDATKAATLANRVSAAQRSRTVKDDGYEIYKARVSMGEPLDDSKANREHTDRYAAAALEVNDSLPEDQRQRPVDILINTYKASGLVGQTWQTRLQSASSEEGLARSAEFWSALHSDPYRQIEDGLSGDRRGIYEMINRRAKDGGMSWIDASRDVMDITKIDEITGEVRKQRWVDEDGGDKAGNYYVDLIDSNHYDKMSGIKIPFYGRFELEDHEENKARYRMYLQDGMTLTGNWEDAKVHADEVFKASHVLTNINGKDELQVGGIASDLGNGSDIDLSPLREKFVEGIKGRQMMFTNVDGSTKLGTIDSAEGITLDDPEKILGETIYKVSSYGNRIVNPQTGLQLEVSFDGMDTYQLQVDQAKGWSEKRFREQQAELQSDMDALSGDISFGRKVGKDVSAEERLLSGKEDVMMEKERQRRAELDGAPEF